MKINPNVTYNFGRKNILINANFDIWQRNTSFTTPANSTYTADRWIIGYDGTSGTFTTSRQPFTIGQTAVSGEPTYFYRWNQTVAGAGSTLRNIQQRIEGVRSLAGQTCTVSFWATADTARTITPEFVQSFGSGGSPSANVTISGVACNVTTSWQKFTQTYNIPSISGKTLGTASDFLAFYIRLPLNTTMIMDIAQVQVEAGSVASPFEVRSIGEELRNCQRYYWKSFLQTVAPAQNVGVNQGEIYAVAAKTGATVNETTGVRFPSVMRAAPAIVLFNPAAANAQARDISLAADTSGTGVSQNNEIGFRWGFTGNAGQAAGDLIGINATADAEL